VRSGCRSPGFPALILRGVRAWHRQQSVLHEGESRSSPERREKRPGQAGFSRRLNLFSGTKNWLMGGRDAWQNEVTFARGSGATREFRAAEGNFDRRGISPEQFRGKPCGPRWNLSLVGQQVRKPFVAVRRLAGQRSATGLERLETAARIRAGHDRKAETVHRRAGNRPAGLNIKRVRSILLYIWLAKCRSEWQS
jgi:hypothetical protein